MDEKMDKSLQGMSDFDEVELRRVLRERLELPLDITILPARISPEIQRRLDEEFGAIVDDKDVDAKPVSEVGGATLCDMLEVQVNEEGLRYSVTKMARAVAIAIAKIEDKDNANLSPKTTVPKIMEEYRRMIDDKVKG